MLVSLCSKEFDLAGAILFDVPAPELGDIRRRGNRIATLDGGAAVNDYGYSPADRTFTFRWLPTAAEAEVVRRLSMLHQRLTVSVSEGVFECVLGSFTIGGGGIAVLQVLPITALTE